MLKIYVDTSVVGGCLDDEFSVWSCALFDEFRAGLKIPVISDLTLQELEHAPVEVRRLLLPIEDKIEYVFFNEQAASLAMVYLNEQIVTPQYLLDAQHIALASVMRADVLVSWNFKHIVNLNRIRLYNSVNMKCGFPMIDIRSPREVLYEKED
jgi:hypothetical protein